jgi:hypothetical protein
VDVKDYYIAAADRPAGWIRTVIGHVVVLHEDTGQAYFATGGDAIFKHDVVFTLKESRCRLKFTTDDIITMGDNARVGIEEYVDDRVKQKKSSVFSMLRGKAMFYALRLFKYRTASSSVKTPTAIIGVRGTQFGVEVRKIGDNRAAGRPVYLADASDSGLKYLLSQLDPAQFEVTTHCFDGIIDTVSLIDNITTVLTQGQSQAVTAAGAGEAFATPDHVAADFTQATAAPDPEAAKGEGEAAAPTPADTAPETPVDAGAPAEDDLTPPDIENPDKELDLETQGKPRKGYFAGMLAHHSTSWLENVYVSTSRQDFGSATTTIRAEGLHHESGNDAFLDGIPGQSFDDPRLKQVKSYDYMDTIISADNLNLAVTHQEIDHNDYQEWGWWYVAQEFLVGTDLHDLWHKGYYIFGEPTPDDGVCGLSGDYSGPAYGTYWDASGSAPQGVDMTGSFSCEISSGAINNFSMSVSGGGKSASISGAYGTFSSSSFDVTGGTWNLNGTPLVPGTHYMGAHGSLYGPNGEDIGGNWGMYKDSANGAAGIFQGKKQ